MDDHGKDAINYLLITHATSLIRTFMEDDNLVLTIRGRKRTPQFHFNVDEQEIVVDGVQIEVDAGYESQKQVVLIEAKNAKTTNTIIRQLYYPFRQWQNYHPSNRRKFRSKNH